MSRSLAACLVLMLACRGPSGHLTTVEEEVTFRNGAMLFAGTLVRPETSATVPAVVLVHGSGPETRQLYLRYAREFASAGIAALAYDKRGAGESSPGDPRAPFDTLAGDVLAAVEMLRIDSRIDGSRIGLFGLSEGEWVAPLAASKMDSPAFIVLVSASSVSPSDQVRTEMRNRLRAGGYGDSVVARADALYSGIAAFQRDGSGRDSMNLLLQAAASEPWFAEAEVLDPQLPEYERVLALSWFPSWRANMDFDALRLLRSIDAPLLVMLGGKDLNNDPRLSERRYLDLRRLDSDRTVDVRVFPEAEHALVEWWLPLRLPPPRYPEGYFEEIVTWTQQVVGRQ